MENVVAKEVCIGHYIILLVFLVIFFMAEDVKLKFMNKIWGLHRNPNLSSPFNIIRF